MERKSAESELEKVCEERLTYGIHTLVTPSTKLFMLSNGKKSLGSKSSNIKFFTGRPVTEDIQIDVPSSSFRGELNASVTEMLRNSRNPVKLPVASLMHPSCILDSELFVEVSSIFSVVGFALSRFYGKDILN